MSDRVYTPARARQVLDKIKPTAEKMCRLYRELERKRPGRVVSDQRVEPGYMMLLERLNRALGEIHRWGVQVKDVRRGLLDFPARREGRLVLLCWRVGEPALGFWHETAEGFSGRQPLDDDGPWEGA